MSIYFLLSAACLVALPILGAWYTGVELVAPLWWRARMLRQGYAAPRMLLPPPGQGAGTLAETRDPAVRRLIDEATATRGGPFTKDFVDFTRDRPIYVRTQARTVDASGAQVGIPYTLEEHSRTRSVVVAWVVIDLREVMSSRVLLHVEAGREERSFGDEGLVAALLDGATRDQLADGDKLSISEGFVVLESPFLLADRVADPVVDAVDRLADRLARVCPPHNRRPLVSMLLRENLEHDPQPAVRAAAADLLIAHHPDQADWAAARALADRRAEVRFAAARHLGEEGFEVLEQVVFEGPDAPGSRDGLRQRALRFAVREFPPDRVRPLLARAIEEGPDALRQIAVTQLGDLGQRAGAELAERALRLAREPATVAAACDAVARIGDQAHEGRLVELLADGRREVLRAAIEALAQIGTIGSVPALSRLAESGTDREIRLAAATTIPIVQTRGAPEALGALSVVESSGGGELAVSDPERPPRRGTAADDPLVQPEGLQS